MTIFTLNNLNVYGVCAKLLQLCLILCSPTDSTSLVAQTVKNPAMRETWVQSLGWEDPLEKGMATHSNIFPGEIHGQSSISGYGPWGRKESETTNFYFCCGLQPTGLAPLSMGFSRQEYWSGLLCPPPVDLPNPGIKPGII